MLTIPGRAEPFHHTDRNVLVRTGPAIPNPLVRESGVKSRSFGE
jgi:hypothetical protein